jgi:type VI secretion system secreted protein Hcp
MPFHREAARRPRADRRPRQRTAGPAGRRWLVRRCRAGVGEVGVRDWPARGHLARDEGELTMAVNAFLTFFDKADGESVQKGKEKWIEIQRWGWELAAASSWTMGGGATVGKPKPGTLTVEHRFDTASIVILGYICTGKAFPKVELQLAKITAKGLPETYFTMTMEGVFITRVANLGTDDGNVVQSVDMVFKTVKIEYKPQSGADGTLAAPKTYNWDIPAGTASPSG